MARWHSCNILQSAADANRLWQFDARSGALSREHSGDSRRSLPGKMVAKSWSSLWQPRLNVAWLPLEKVFLRVVELPKSNLEETHSMVELQLEKLSPIPATQLVWTFHVLGKSSAENLQTVIVVIAERKEVEEFLGKLESRQFLADRLETPMLDQLESTVASEDGAWIYPASLNGQNAALVAWWFGGALRSLSIVTLHAEERVKNLQGQFSQLIWAGELEGWLTAQPKFHLVAEGALADEWATALNDALGEPAQVIKPMSLQELAARTARRTSKIQQSKSAAALLPMEFSARYHQRFVDRLWLRGLIATGILYAICVVIYFCSVGIYSIKTKKVEGEVAAISNDYTNALQLKARYNVLAERQNLKFAALDCWKIVAENLPEGISLSRSSFVDGQKLTLSGICTQDQIGLISASGKFYDSVRKAKSGGQDVFEPTPIEPLIWSQSGNNISWHFTLKLKHSEKID